jgi:uncharacterized circularly permuted ATP-grasp superfamily protein
MCSITHLTSSSRICRPGGYGADGAASRQADHQPFRAKLKSNPKSFVAQPPRFASTCPTCVQEGVAPRQVDLRPFVLTGRDRLIVPAD